MTITEIASMTTIHPATLNKVRAVRFTFDSGYRCTVAADGYRWYNNPSMKKLSTVTGHKLIAEMDRLISEGRGAA